jgi:hypothetical protein
MFKHPPLARHQMLDCKQAESSQKALTAFTYTDFNSTCRFTPTLLGQLLPKAVPNVAGHNQPKISQSILSSAVSKIKGTSMKAQVVQLPEITSELSAKVKAGN